MPRMNIGAAISMPVNYLPPIDDTDFKSRESSIVYNQAGLEIYFMFLTFAGVETKTQITPTTGGGDYDWASLSNGMYTIGIPGSGGASVNNDTLGYGWITGIATGVLPWSGPIVEFRAAEGVTLTNSGIDAILIRAISNAEGSASSRCLLWAIAKLTNKVATVGTSLQIKKTNDTDNQFTQTITSDAVAEPITSVDTD